MAEQENTDAGAPTSDGNEQTARFSTPRLILAIVALLLGAIVILMTMGPSLSPGKVLVFDEAFVHGAVADIGIAEDGRIAQLHVALGDRVEVGDVVATLESERLTARVRADEAQVQRLKTELERAVVADRIVEAQAESDLSQSESEAVAAEARRRSALAQLVLREREFERSTELAERQVVAQAELDAAQGAVREARALLARRRAELEVAQGAVEDARVELERAELRAAERAVLRERIAQAEAELSRSEAELANTEITARERGIVVAVPSRAGSSLRPNDTLVSVWNTDQTWMLVWAAEDRVARISVGDTAEIEIDALADQVFQGVVRRVLVAADGQERTLPGQPISPLLSEETRFTVYVAFDPDAAAPGSLLPGMSGRVRIRTGLPPGERSGLERLWNGFSAMSEN